MSQPFQSLHGGSFETILKFSLMSKNKKKINNCYFFPELGEVDLQTPESFDYKFPHDQTFSME